jgi:hypothetical protein
MTAAAQGAASPTPTLGVPSGRRITCPVRFGTDKQALLLLSVVPLVLTAYGSSSAARAAIPSWCRVGRGAVGR